MARHKRVSSGNFSDSQNNSSLNQAKQFKPYDSIVRHLFKFGITVCIGTFIGLIIRFAVKEFDPNDNNITLTTLKIDNKDIASLSVSKHLLERLLEIVEESLSALSVVLPIGFPLCSLINSQLAFRRSHSRVSVKNKKAFAGASPKYLIIGDSAALINQHHHNSKDDDMISSKQQTQLRPLARETLQQLVSLRIKPKLVIEESFDEACRLAIKLGILCRQHHKLAAIKSVDLLKLITDSSGDIKLSKVRLLLSKLKVMAQSTPADKSLLVYLIKQCELLPNDGLLYFANNLTDSEPMNKADCSLAYESCDEVEITQAAHLLLRTSQASSSLSSKNCQSKHLASSLLSASSASSKTATTATSKHKNINEELNFCGVYLAIVVSKLANNINQSFALYQVSVAIVACIYRFLSIMVFSEQLVTRSQFALLLLVQQIIAIGCLMSKWLASLPQASLESAYARRLANMPTTGGRRSMAASPAIMSAGAIRSRSQSRSAPSTSIVATNNNSSNNFNSYSNSTSHSNNDESQDERQYQANTIGRNKSNLDVEAANHHRTHSSNNNRLSSSSSSSSFSSNSDIDDEFNNNLADGGRQMKWTTGGHLAATNSRIFSISNSNFMNEQQQQQQQGNKMTSIDLNLTLINAAPAVNYKQSFHNSNLMDDANLRLMKLHVTYQIMIISIIMIFGKFGVRRET